MKRLLLLGLAAACGPGEGRGVTADDPGPPRLRATVIRPQPDTNRFATPAVARRCADGRTLLLEGVSERGEGVLVWLRYGDMLAAGAFPLSALGDSTTGRGANVAVRYMTGDAAHGFALDRGRVDLTSAGPSFSARVRGSGLEGSVRDSLAAEYADVPLAPDTVPCRFAP